MYVIDEILNDQLVDRLLIMPIPNTNTYFHVKMYYPAVV